VKYLDQIATIEYGSRSNHSKSKRHSSYSYFSDILIVCIIKLFRDNLELLIKSVGNKLKFIFF